MRTWEQAGCSGSLRARSCRHYLPRKTQCFQERSSARKTRRGRSNPVALHQASRNRVIDNIRVSASTVEIDLSDGGAQEGSLTFYSKQALKAAGSENCEIVSVKDLGDDIWQVNLTGRQWGTAQSLALTIQ